MEFDLIRTYFHRPLQNDKIILGNGDDCALLRSNHTLALSIDSLVAGTHFIENAISPFDLGHRALAVNLSDLAAMGATPLAFLLALTLPATNENWLAEFSRGLFSLAEQYALNLIGGNTTKGPLAITIQIIGELPLGKGLQRNAAKIGDAIYVTGNLGRQCIRPYPPVTFAARIVDLAHAAIDISDGLSQDLAHVLTASRVGAVLDLQKIPTTNLDAALYGGEDYELCFTAPPHHEAALQEIARATHTPLTRIGEIIAKPGLWHIHAGKWQALIPRGYQHF